MSYKRTLTLFPILITCILFFLTACTTEPEKNHILITHSDQPEPTEFPADVEYNYIIEDGYKLPKDTILVTFDWKQNGSYNQKFWMYEVKKNEEGYTILGTDYEGFYVEDVTELGYSPVSELTQRKGTITIRVANKNQYEKVLGKHPYKKGTHLFEDILVKEK